ncbi:MAG: 1-deoxy-D-xylulose-5-phosphate reductoisomerase [Phycisphaeraceae bacterium]|nr:1-deoxy-D-xylulose-5-phosphate reductoisomerase [Phycisphaeraceae bacterium]MCW5755396.1 1-deoxy-D-xylulose-5-phosphate reductoisomerase [Phycisphaeraceae bacterium]
MNTSDAITRVIVLGATGSIGTQTLEVIEHLNTLRDRGRARRRYQVVGLAAGSRGADLAALAHRFGDPTVAIADRDIPCTAKRVLRGADAPERLVRETPCDLVVAAMVGAAGLPATLEAVRLGLDVALANKETLVAAGSLVLAEARAHGARLLPLDSEHSGIWQAMCGATDPAHACAPPNAPPRGLRRLVLTASGGPFRGRSADELARVTPEEAMRHPTWRMGPKNTIDSATLMNKGLELIEAHWLFGVPSEQLDVLVHPQSIVHALLELTDGSVLAQLGATSMKGPIQWALTFPDRAEPPVPMLDLAALARLDFEPPDHDRFPAIGLARLAMQKGGVAPAAMNAANEIAVRAFLEKTIRFVDIPEIVREVMESVAQPTAVDLNAIGMADAQARELAQQRTQRRVAARTGAPRM